MKTVIKQQEDLLPALCRLLGPLFGKRKGLQLAVFSIYAIISSGATALREAGQGRNPAALSDVSCVLFFILSIHGAGNSQVLFVFFYRQSPFSRV